MVCVFLITINLRSNVNPHEFFLSHNIQSQLPVPNKFIMVCAQWYIYVKITDKQARSHL